MLLWGICACNALSCDMWSVVVMATNGKRVDLNDCKTSFVHLENGV